MYFHYWEHPNTCILHEGCCFRPIPFHYKISSLGLTLWHNRSSYRLPVPVLAAPPPIHLPVDALGKLAEEDDPSVWAPASHVGHPDGVVTPGVNLVAALAV